VPIEAFTIQDTRTDNLQLLCRTGRESPLVSSFRSEFKIFQTPSGVGSEGYRTLPPRPAMTVASCLSRLVVDFTGLYLYNTIPSVVPY
jgi:hypothetical protein